MRRSSTLYREQGHFWSTFNGVEYVEIYLALASAVAGILAVVIGIAQPRRTPRPEPVNPRDLVHEQFEASE